jgi:hypothetical protein
MVAWIETPVTITAADLLSFSFALKVEVHLESVGLAFYPPKDALSARERVPITDDEVAVVEARRQRKLDETKLFEVRWPDGTSVEMERPEFEWILSVAPAAAAHFEKQLKRRVAILFFEDTKLPGTKVDLGQHRVSGLEKVALNIGEQKVAIMTARCGHCDGRFIGR